MSYLKFLRIIAKAIKGKQVRAGESVYYSATERQSILKFVLKLFIFH